MRSRRALGRGLDRVLATPRELARSAPAGLGPLAARAADARSSNAALEEQLRGLRTQLEALRRDARPPAERHRTEGLPPETDRLRPSLIEPVRARRRHRRDGVGVGEGFDPPGEFESKLDVRRFALAHGLRVPAMRGPWPTPDDIPWADLPGELVLKGTRGAGALSVFPLETRDGELFDLIEQRPTTQAAITQALWHKRKPGEQYFVEELLTSTGPSGVELPYDVKVFCSHEGPLWIEVRRGAWTRLRGGVLELKVLAPDGTHLETARPLSAQDAAIATPVHLPELVAHCERVARSIRSRFFRLDFYETDQGLFFGEVTPFPGRSPAHGDDLNRSLGGAFEAGSARLLATLAAEGALAVRHGEE